MFALVKPVTKSRRSTLQMSAAELLSRAASGIWLGLRMCVGSILVLWMERCARLGNQYAL